MTADLPTIRVEPGAAKSQAILRIVQDGDAVVDADRVGAVPE